LFNSTKVPVLVIAYRRYKNLSNILDLCKKNGVEKIYIAIDGAKSETSEGVEDKIKTLVAVSHFSREFTGEVKLMERNVNLGCAPSVLSACDWIFEKEELAIILEDDCIPTSDFFDFSRQSLGIIAEDTRVWLSCGTQFFPPSRESDDWFLSKYPLTWGWATTKNNWMQISKAIKSQKKLKGGNFTFAERVYWNAGARRAQSGWVDVWDTILAQQLLVMNKLVLLPRNNLVVNVGNDSVATHTFGNSEWMGTKIGNFSTPVNIPRQEPTVDIWLQKKFFRIRNRHLFSTRFTLIVDLIMASRKPFAPLIARWNFAEENRTRPRVA
jgi:hypothetical protein